MSDGRHAELLQVLSRQVAEDVAVDLIVTEHRLVFAEPKAPQPVSHVHGRVPKGYAQTTDQPDMLFRTRQTVVALISGARRPEGEKAVEIRIAYVFFDVTRIASY